MNFLIQHLNHSLISHYLITISYQQCPICIITIFVTLRVNLSVILESTLILKSVFEKKN